MKSQSSDLDALVSSKCRADLLRAVAIGAVGEEFTINELAAKLGHPRTSLVPEIARLCRLGVMDGRRVGSGRLYRFGLTSRTDAVRRLVQEFDRGQLGLFGPES